MIILYLIYIDESGKPPFTDPENYVLSAVIVHESEWEDINLAVNNLKKTIIPHEDPSDFEIHVRDILRGSEAFHGFSIAKRHKIMENIGDLIGNSQCTLISILVEKDRIFKRLKTSEWVEKWAWRLLCERLEKFLENKNPSDSIEDFGLICMDSENPLADESIRLRIRRFRAQGTRYIDCRYLIEDPFFVSSELTNVIQLADFVAWVTRRKYRLGSNQRYESLYHDWFDLIKHKYDHKNGIFIGYGIKKHP